jgi:CRISPR-associated exonuclease Cas4
MKRMVSAGDLEKYAYCPLSWWLSLKEKEHTEEQSLGIKKHRETEKKVEEIAIKEKESAYLGKFVFWFSLVASALSILGLMIWPIYSDLLTSRIMVAEALLWLIFSLYFLIECERKRGEKRKLERMILITSVISAIVAIYAMVSYSLSGEVYLSRIMQVLALLWLIGATFFLRRSTILEAQAKDARKKMKVPDGEIIYVDLDDESSKLLVSENYGLTGRPDHIIKKDGHYIPVELKTGRTPRGPLFSHIIQVCTYCIIIEDIMGKKPPYGIIKYPKRSFEIEYTEDMKKMVLDLMDKLLSDLEKGGAHRNHNRPGKCRNCSRRDICPERLA